MKAIKLITGVTATCWHSPYGDVDDRVRYIAHALNLTTIIWKYDSFDWLVGANNITASNVDTNYQLFINNETSGMFSTAGGIMFTHELNNFTMSEAVKWYPQLKQAFKNMVPIGVALNKTQPYVETNYSLPSFQQYNSGQITVSATLSSSAPSSSSNASMSSINKKSSAVTISVLSSGTLWTLLSAGVVLSGLLL